MAHIQDGILSAPVLIGGAALTVAACASAFRGARDSDIPRAAVLSSVFFAGSMIAVPLGLSTVHLMFSGLMGLMLGWLAVPAVLAALVLQLALFGFGGLTTLGINAFNIAMPGVVMALILRQPIRAASPLRAKLLAGLCGGVAAVATGGLVAASLALSFSEFVPAAKVITLTYLPLALVEGVICAVAASYLQRALPSGWLAFAR